MTDVHHDGKALSYDFFFSCFLMILDTRTHTTPDGLVRLARHLPSPVRLPCLGRDSNQMRNGMGTGAKGGNEQWNCLRFLLLF